MQKQYKAYDKSKPPRTKMEKKALQAELEHIENEISSNPKYIKEELPKKYDKSVKKKRKELLKRKKEIKKFKGSEKEKKTYAAELKRLDDKLNKL